jgi:hypothetical protein
VRESIIDVRGMETKNAIITSAELLIDHNCLTGWIYLEHNDGYQGFGGIALCHSNRIFPELSHTGYWICRVMEVAGVEKWSDLKGKTIRVRGCGKTLDFKIKEIGHIIKDDWFNPEEDFKTAQKQETE